MEINIVYNIIIPIFVLGFFIFIHELGHYIAARVCGIGVKEFALGMGPKIYSFKRKNIQYSLRALPIGGFVNMVGEDEQSDDVAALYRKPIWKRFITLCAGSLMNLICGFILMAILVSMVQGFRSLTIVRFGTGASSEAYGLQIGDEIVKVNSKKINIYNDLVYAVMRFGDEPVNITVKRGTNTVVIPDVRFPTETEEGIVYGTVDFSTDVIKKSPSAWFKQTIFQSLSTIDMVWSTFYDLLTGRYGVSALSGPVGVTQQIGEAAKTSNINFLYLLAVITMNLGVVNLLPLPALDGGRLVFLLIELIRRKPIKPEHEGYVHLAGMAVLLGLMIFITYKDIMNIFVK